MIKFFTLSKLITPRIRSVLKKGYIYVLKYENILYRVSVHSNENGIYLLNIVDKKDNATEDWIQVSHEDYINHFILIDCITAKKNLETLNSTFTPNDIKF